MTEKIRCFSSASVGEYNRNKQEQTVSLSEIFCPWSFLSALLIFRSVLLLTSLFLSLSHSNNSS